MTETFDGLAPLQDCYAIIKHNRKEVIQISRDDYRGSNRLSVRVWFYDDDGRLRPTPKGLSISPNQIDQMIAGLTTARLKMIGAGAL